MYLLEFESQQRRETGIVIKYLKEIWLERIVQSVKLCLRGIGEEWFDSEQKNYDENNIMKLKRLISLITYRMQVYLKVFYCIRFDLLRFTFNVYNKMCLNCVFI